MDVLFLLNNMQQKISNVILRLQQEYPKVKFASGDNFVWSSTNRTVTYINKDDDISVWALIHETAHASLDHKDYTTDHQLLNLETQAWVEAKFIANKLNVVIDQDHIEDCLDTYRDWLHKRATCPSCDVVTLQQQDRNYKCFNCQTIWKVPNSPICQVVRQKIPNRIDPS